MQQLHAKAMYARDAGCRELHAHIASEEACGLASIMLECMTHSSLCMLQMSILVFRMTVGNMHKTGMHNACITSISVVRYQQWLCNASLSMHELGQMPPKP